jgi:hypothetical protein
VPVFAGATSEAGSDPTADTERNVQGIKPMEGSLRLCDRDGFVNLGLASLWPFIQRLCTSIQSLQGFLSVSKLEGPLRSSVEPSNNVGLGAACTRTHGKVRTILST